jgi:hypothetical protein
MRIVSFDPGERTGFCEALVSKDDGIQIVKTCMIVWSERFTVGRRLQGTMEAPLPDAIVVEAFALYSFRAKQQVGSTFPSAQVIGIIETYAYQLGVLDKVHFQMASMISRVRILPEHATLIGRTEHERDAYKHLRYYVVTHHSDGFYIINP